MLLRIPPGYGYVPKGALTPLVLCHMMSRLKTKRYPHTNLWFGQLDLACGTSTVQPQR